MLKNPLHRQTEDESPIEKEPEAPEETAPKARVYLPPPDLSSGIAAFMLSIFGDVDDYSYKIIEGNVAVGDRLKFMLLARAWYVLGLVDAHDPESGRWLDAKLREDERLNGRAFVRSVFIHLGKGMGKSGLFGKKQQDVSIDRGEGERIEELRQGGTLEP